MKIPIQVAWLFLAAPVAKAEGPVLALLAGPGPHVVGTSVIVELLAVNPAAAKTPFPWNGSLPATVAAEGRRLSVTLTASGPSPTAVPAEGFAVRRYQLPLPAGLEGEAVVAALPPQGAPLRLVL